MRPPAQIQGLPTLVFVPAAKDKAALVRSTALRGLGHASDALTLLLRLLQRAEGLLPAETVKKIIADEC